MVPWGEGDRDEGWRVRGCSQQDQNHLHRVALVRSHYEVSCADRESYPGELCPCNPVTTQGDLQEGSNG